MIDGIDVANFVIVSAGLVLTVLGLTLTLIIHGMERAARFFFVSLFSILILYAASDFTSQVSLVLFAGNGNFASLSRSAIFLESFFSSLLMPLLSLFLFHCAGESWKKEGFFYMAAVSALWIVYFILLIVTQFTTSIYAISAILDCQTKCNREYLLKKTSRGVRKPRHFLGRLLSLSATR